MLLLFMYSESPKDNSHLGLQSIHKMAFSPDWSGKPQYVLATGVDAAVINC